MKRFIVFCISIFAVTMLTACNEPTFDASSVEKFEKSSQAVKNSLNEAEANELAKSMDILLKEPEVPLTEEERILIQYRMTAELMDLHKPKTEKEILANLRQIDGLTAKEVNIKAAEKIKAQSAAAELKAKDLAAKRAKVPPFSFDGFTLSDSFEEVIKKGLAGDYIVTATSAGEQDDPRVKMYAQDTHNFGSVDVGKTLPECDAFFPYHSILGGQYSMDRHYLYNFRVSDDVLKSGLVVNIIDLESKKDSSTIRYYFGALPNGKPQALFIRIFGGGSSKESIVRDIPTIYTKRYGEPEMLDASGGNYMWFSNTEAAILAQIPDSCTLVNKIAYDSFFEYATKIDNEIVAKKEEQKRIKEEQRKTENESRI